MRRRPYSVHSDIYCMIIFWMSTAHTLILLIMSTIPTHYIFVKQIFYVIVKIQWVQYQPSPYSPNRYFLSKYQTWHRNSFVRKDTFVAAADILIFGGSWDARRWKLWMKSPIEWEWEIICKVGSSRSFHSNVNIERIGSPPPPLPFRSTTLTLWMWNDSFGGDAPEKTPLKEKLPFQWETNKRPSKTFT